ncbi:proteasome accessory factor PafA2 family protein [Micropruina sonneratiae]|uniref:proteasome accessory factor PafA2 family protein n=1 Tax=Micropruina sonneratiae TaxID=2986940 RepID=UPI0022265500|nr:proteasome accessory factor PafA2 family protein [Micropruina sp. KQZ13P-5]MCW3157701.1 proteasome accessory factor PafA2 family protein [Micropruina sp. KQZ13P-5]
MPLLGTETEYGILAPGRGDLHPTVLSAAVVEAHDGPATLARRDSGDPIPFEDAHNRFLGNGARLYVDHAHPEYSTPETTSPRAALLADLAGDAIVARAASRAGQRLGTPVRLFKNNTDGKGASYGYHENHLLGRATPWERIVEGLLPYLVTRPVFTGAGRVGLGQASQRPGFQLSQRADFFEAITGLETTIRRPLVNTRDEPHADRSRWRRLHLIAGDANRSQTATLLKLGTAAAVLAGIEQGVLRPVRLADPLGAVQTVSRDLSCTARLELADGRRVTAIEVQRDCHAQLQASGLGDPDVMTLWSETLDRLASDPSGCVELDWVAKLNLLERFRARDVLGWDHPRLAQLDLAWADLDDGVSPYAALVRAGRMPLLCTDAEVERAIDEPPPDTRARVRGGLVRENPDAVLALDWSWVLLSTRQGSRRLRLDDPYRHTMPSDLGG